MPNLVKSGKHVCSQVKTCETSWEVGNACLERSKRGQPRENWKMRV